MGINVTEDCFYTSAMATASFLTTQKSMDCSAYVIGGQGIIEEFEKHKITVTSENPDYVVLAETEEYDYKKIIEATHLIREGAKFIATNSDLTGPSIRGSYNFV